MSKQRKHDIGFSNFGFSTILLAFVMICIVTISAISLLTANSDYKLSKKVAEKSTAYYKAEEKAYAKLEEIDTLLALAYQDSTDETGYYEACAVRLSCLDYGTYEVIDMTHTYSYAIPIADGQDLLVILTLQYPNSANDTFYQIYSWQSKYETTIHEAETLNLFQQTRKDNYYGC